ncbi:NAD-dependent succinate-semialdehyde dehydrogenase [Cognatishimia maritima]|uniref:Succinate-semialdehyde dehydrogenase / glutarate-semialdehyde dehydrogenase n=1 Tax=Cognatishimia maritima TaxID=870908 RepID=A0A1M5W080_9RHOB|nr:NAD-dependent succinate-semialdehyde dehydrogenase [Cognatishimia maritima]SHH80624.1 succinate-semialdehyde dehydrogenase / glutarate-semialdehyde dehydrogenase [Cognatishimia maritima]
MDVNQYIAGQWQKLDGREALPLLNPANGLEIAKVPVATTADLDLALSAAADALPGWRRTSPIERGSYLRRAASLIRERQEEIAQLLTLEQGKIIADARAEVLAAADLLDWFAEEARRSYGRLMPSRAPGWRQSVIQEPVGIVAAFSPWNFPATAPMRKIAGSLAAGCTCIIKPSEETPLTAQALTQALHDSGLPRGVLNVVYGVPSMISTYLLDSPEVRKLSFTGPTSVGKHLGELAAKRSIRTTMELGGHAPVLVFDDVDVDAVAELAARNKYRNAGQVCVSPTRFYVQESAFDRFTEKFTETARALTIGDGSNETVQMGPLANDRRITTMERLITQATDSGAKLALGGARIKNAGFFWQPSILTDVSDDAAAMNEEPFGPLAVISPFENTDQAIEKANRLSYGLAAYAFTKDADRIVQIGDEVEAGAIGLNTYAIISAETPFGGLKDSGHGSEGGIEGLQSYLATKFVSQSPAQF